MGKQNPNGNQQPSGIIENEQTEGNGNSGNGNGNETAGSSTSPTTPAPRGRGGRGRGRGTSTGEQGETVPKMVSVIEKTPEQLEKEERRRQQKRDSDQRRRDRLKAEKEGKPVPAPKKGQAKKQTPAPVTINTTQINILIQTFSMIISNREGLEHWKLEPYEIEQIMTPLSSILSKYEGVGESLGKYADHIALTMAVGTIFVPRLIIQFQKSKAKKEGGKNVDKLRTKPSTAGSDQPSREVTSSDRPNAKQPTDVGTNVSKQLFEVLPSLGSF